MQCALLSLCTRVIEKKLKLKFLPFRSIYLLWKEKFAFLLQKVYPVRLFFSKILKFKNKLNSKCIHSPLRKYKITFYQLSFSLYTYTLGLVVTQGHFLSGGDFSLFDVMWMYAVNALFLKHFRKFLKATLCVMHYMLRCSKNRDVQVSESFIVPEETNANKYVTIFVYVLRDVERKKK